MKRPFLNHAPPASGRRRPDRLPIARWARGVGDMSAGGGVPLVGAFVGAATLGLPPRCLHHANRG
jgi:hypothetical protein